MKIKKSILASDRCQLERYPHSLGYHIFTRIRDSR